MLIPSRTRAMESVPTRCSARRRFRRVGLIPLKRRSKLQGRTTMHRKGLFLGISFAFALALTAPGDGLAQSLVLLKGATIIDGLSDAPIRDKSVLIEGNLIRDLPPADAATPARAEVLDLSGKFIIPGLFDSHVHWEEWMGELYVNHGVTSIVALDNVPKALRTKSQDAPDLPRLFHSGARPPFTTNGSEAEIREAVRTWLKNEPDLANFPTHNETIARAYAIAADETHKAGLLVFGHAENAPAALKDGMDIVEHIWGFAQATMSPEDLKSFQEGKFLTWATFMTDWKRLDSMIANAVRQGAYL